MVTRGPFRQGDVWLADLSSTVGHEQRGRRPVLILSRTEHNMSSNIVTVAPLTSSMALRRHPGVLFLSAEDTGARKDSLVLLFQIRAIDHLRFERCLFSLSADHMEEVFHILSGHFGRSL